MIYFDNNKKANGFVIENPLCTVEDTEWNKYSTLILGTDYDITSNGIVDLRETDEYKKKRDELEKLNKIQELKKSLADLDSKRIRAVCEMEIKDTQTGETWLNYYNSQIKTLREELALLQV